VVEILGFHCHGPGSIPVGELRSCKQVWAKKKFKAKDIEEKAQAGSQSPGGLDLGSVAF